MVLLYVSCVYGVSSVCLAVGVCILVSMSGRMLYKSVYMRMPCVTVGLVLGVLLPSVRLSGVLLIESLEFCSGYSAISSVFAVAYALWPRAGRVENFFA